MESEFQSISHSIPCHPCEEIFPIKKERFLAILPQLLHEEYPNSSYRQAKYNLVDVAADLLVSQLKVISMYEFLKIETSTCKVEVLNAMEKFCEIPINLGPNNEFFYKLQVL